MNIDKNTAWFFGDSFTEGWGLLKDQPYYEEYPELISKLWPTIVSDALNLTEMNLGKGGNSIPMIIYDIIIQMSSFKKGDWVFMSDTLIGRFLEAVPNDNRIRSSVFEKNEDKEYLTKRKLSTLEFIENCIYPYESSWRTYYTNQYKGIFKELVNRGVNVVYWSSDIWAIDNKFKTIREASNNKIQDGHWDWIGHEEMANYILSLNPNELYLFNTNVI